MSPRPRRIAANPLGSPASAPLEGISISPTDSYHPEKITSGKTRCIACYTENKMTYDLIVIGRGPGGYSAAVRAGQYGLKTAVIEKDAKLGGTCLHVGCIPTKSLLHTADVWEYFKHSAEQGIQCENPKLDYPKVLDRKNKIVAKHAKGVEILMKKNKVDWIKGFGTLKARAASGLAQVEVKADGGTQTLEAKNVIIATGSEARMLPGLKPDPRIILTNIEILDLPVVPKTMVIIGAGAVGVEFA